MITKEASEKIVLLYNLMRWYIETDKTADHIGGYFFFLHFYHHDYQYTTDK